MDSFKTFQSVQSARPIKLMAGFAYIWTLMLVGFMGIGLVVGSELYATASTRDKERELLFIGRQFREAIGHYYRSVGAGGQEQYPLTLDELLKDSRSLNPQRHLRRIYTDPMTGKAKWGMIIVNGRIAGIHSLSVKTPIKQDNFEPTEDGFKGKGKYADWVFTYPANLLVPKPDAPGAADNGQPGKLNPTPGEAGNPPKVIPPLLGR